MDKQQEYALAGISVVVTRDAALFVASKLGTLAAEYRETAARSHNEAERGLYSGSAGVMQEIADALISNALWR